MIARRAATIASAEIRAGLRNPLFWAAGAAVVGFTATINPAALVPTGDAAIGGLRPAATAPLAFAQVFALSGFLLYAFVAALLLGLAVLRDEEAQVGELLFSSSLQPKEYVAGKIAGGGILLGALLAVQTALLVAIYGFRPGAAHGILETVANTVSGAALFAAPAIISVAGTAYALGEWSRRAVAVGALPTLLLVFTLGVSWTWHPPDLPAWANHLLVVIDPTAIRWLRVTAFASDRGVELYNHAPVPIDRWFLANRVFTLLLPLAAVAAATRLCRRRVRGIASVARVAPSRSPRPVSQIPPTSSAPTIHHPSAWRTALVVAATDLRESRANPALLAFAGLVVLLGVEPSLTATDGAGMPVFLPSGREAVASLFPVSILGALLLVFLVVELLLHDRARRVAPLVFSTAIPNRGWILGKAISSLAVMAAISGTIVAGSALAATVRTGAFANPQQLLLVHLLLIPTWIVWSGFLSVVAVLTRSRYAAYAVAMAALAMTILAFQRGRLVWTTNWPLWTGWRWSDFGAFELDGPALLANRLLMTLVGAALLALAAATMERRERDWVATPLFRRLQAAPRPRLVAWGLPIVALAAAMSFQIAGGFEGSAVQRRAKQSWQRHFAAWVAFEPPRLDHVQLHLVLDPATRAVAVTGRYRLVHGGAEALSVVPFTVPDPIGAVSWSIAGETPRSDRQGSIDLLHPRAPIAPGDTFEVDFVYRARHPRGWSRNGGVGAEYLTASALRLGSRNTGLFPLAGFDPNMGVDRGNRYETPDSTLPRWLRTIPVARVTPGRFTTDITIDAPIELELSATGDLVERREQGGRVHTRWRSQVAVPAWDVTAVRTVHWTAIRADGAAVLHHPRHARNAAPILATATAAREHYGRWLDHDLPWRELRIQEVPDHHLEAISYPSNVSLSESMAFSAAPHFGLPPAFAVVAHEVAHQWFPHLVAVADEPGAVVLIEGMANYFSLALAEDLHGSEARRRLARWMERGYLDTRRVDGERALLDLSERNTTEEQAGALRGALALWVLHRELGAEAMRRGLAAAAELSQSGSGLRLHDLLATLEQQAVDPTAFRKLARQWFATTTLPELALRAATARPAAGAYLVRFEVVNLGTGHIAPVLALRGRAAGEEVRTVVSVEPSAGTTIELTVPFPPVEVVADPDADLLQLHRDRARATFGPSTSASPRR